jgi:hypothetical protein
MRLIAEYTVSLGIVLYHPVLLLLEHVRAQEQS